MNLSKLFETQKQLDQNIVEKHGLQGVDLLDKKILALQVEIGELANEWRGFKFWSSDQEPRTSIHVLKKEYQHLHITQTGMWEYQLRDEFGKVIFDDVTDDHHVHKNPLLEEYVDCLHFILSIGNDIDTDFFEYDEFLEEPEENITKQFQKVFGYVFLITEDNYCSELLNSFIILGDMLGFTWEQIEQAYYAKNQINYERQANGY